MKLCINRVRFWSPSKFKNTGLIQVPLLPHAFEEQIDHGLEGADYGEVRG